MMARSIAALLLACLVGCSYVNTPMNDGSILLENRAKNSTRAETFSEANPPQFQSSVMDPRDRELHPTTQSMPRPPAMRADSDGYFVGLALSGGGSRSANFSAACMFQLERIGMLQKVDYISSVSGGSLPAAYYCLNRQAWNPQNVEQKLSHPFATDMLIQQLLPWTILEEIFTDYDRSDLLAWALNRELFTSKGHQQTYADLLPDRPRLLINATDLQSGRRFVFCNQTFDQLNSNLAVYPIAYAVAASSSVPVVLHQVTLRDFSTAFKQYRHLIDGGVADNLGVESLVETYRAQEDNADTYHLPDPYPNGAVFIAVDAHVEYGQDISSESDTGFLESITSAAGLTSTLLSRASSATLDDVVLKNAPATAPASQLRDAVTALEKDGFIEFETTGHHKIRVIHIALTQLQGLNGLPFHSFEESVNSTSTYFNIDPNKAGQLYTAADLLIRAKFETKLRTILQEMNDLNPGR